ncbi:MAG: FAD-binding protein [bacterium]|nr:FAD-binding protein [bacterium]
MRSGVPGQRWETPQPLEAARAQLRKLSGKGALQVYERVDLRAWNPLGVGGTADVLIRCDTEPAVQNALDVLATYGLPWLVLGSGSRVVFSDDRLRVPILSLAGQLATWEMDLDGVVVGARANMTQLVAAISRSGLSPPENSGNHPGSLGGWLHYAVASVSTLVKLSGWMRYRLPGAKPVDVSSALVSLQDLPELGGLRSPVVVSARLELEPASGSVEGGYHLGMRAGSLVGTGRKLSIPVFELEDGGKAEPLLHAAGCASLVVGTARSSRESVNRITTTTNARARDVLLLCREMRDRVQNVCSVKLRSRLRFIDEGGSLIVV